MANDMNLCLFTGRLGADPETRHTTSGSAVTNLRLAVGNSWRDKDSGEKKETVEWVPVVMFGKLAEISAEYLKKGSQCRIGGRFQTRKWQAQDGQDRWTTEIVANEMQMLGGRPESSGSRQVPANAENVAVGASSKTPVEDFDEEIPF